MADADKAKTLAVALLRLPDGRIAVQRRTKDAPTAAGRLGFFGGHIDPGEDPDVCIRRELAEETSLDVGGLEIKFLQEKQLQPTESVEYDRHFYVYEAFIPDTNFEVYEGVGTEFYMPEELKTRDDLSDFVRRFMQDYVS